MLNFGQFFAVIVKNRLDVAGLFWGDFQFFLNLHVEESLDAPLLQFDLAKAGHLLFVENGAEGLQHGRRYFFHLFFGDAQFLLYLIQFEQRSGIQGTAEAALATEAAFAFAARLLAANQADNQKRRCQCQ